MLIIVFQSKPTISLNVCPMAMPKLLCFLQRFCNLLPIYIDIYLWVIWMIPIFKVTLLSPVNKMYATVTLLRDLGFHINEKKSPTKWLELSGLLLDSLNNDHPDHTSR